MPNFDAAKDCDKMTGGACVAAKFTVKTLNDDEFVHRVGMLGLMVNGLRTCATVRLFVSKQCAVGEQGSAQSKHNDGSVLAEQKATTHRCPEQVALCLPLGG